MRAVIKSATTAEALVFFCIKKDDLPVVPPPIPMLPTSTKPPASADEQRHKASRTRKRRKNQFLRLLGGGVGLDEGVDAERGASVNIGVLAFLQQVCWLCHTKYR